MPNRTHTARPTRRETKASACSLPSKNELAATAAPGGAVAPLAPPPPAGAASAPRLPDVPAAVPAEPLGVPGARVLGRVRESFRDEPVGGEVDAGRELLRLALDPQVDGEPGLAR